MHALDGFSAGRDGPPSAVLHRALCGDSQPDVEPLVAVPRPVGFATDDVLGKGHEHTEHVYNFFVWAQGFV